MKPVQYFTPDYLNQCRKMSPSEIAEFLEAFRLLHGSQGQPVKSRLISLKVPEDLLAAFRRHCDQHGLKYQSQIKSLMRDWLDNVE